MFLRSTQKVISEVRNILELTRYFLGQHWLWYVLAPRLLSSPKINFIQENREEDSIVITERKLKPTVVPSSTLIEADL